jgi:high-affinity iron transporter
VLLSSVILVLREVLEAALLVSLLLAFSRKLSIHSSWVLIAIVAGLLGSAIYGFNIELVSELFEGVGQEVVNALLQICIYLLLCSLAVFAVRHYRGAHVPLRLVTIVMTLCVLLAIVREGSEVMLYISGFVSLPDLRVPVMAGSAIGAGIGLSVGAVFYYAILSLHGRAAAIVGAFLLSLVAAGMASQAAQLLIQADWLPSHYPVWDTSWLIDEQSVTGQLLYALIGYEATPTALQVAIHFASIMFIILVAVLFGKNKAGAVTRAGAVNDV